MSKIDKHRRQFTEKVAWNAAEIIPFHHEPKKKSVPIWYKIKQSERIKWNEKKIRAESRILSVGRTHSIYAITNTIPKEESEMKWEKQHDLTNTHVTRLLSVESTSRHNYRLLSMGVCVCFVQFHHVNLLCWNLSDTYARTQSGCHCLHTKKLLCLRIDHVFFYLLL